MREDARGCARMRIDDNIYELARCSADGKP